MVDRVQTSEINNSTYINGVVQKSFSIYLSDKKLREQSLFKLSEEVVE